MGKRSRLPRRVGRGALIALVAIVLGASATAGASSAGPTAAQQEDPGVTAQPIPAGAPEGEQATAATPGDVTALAASNLTYSTVDPCRIFDTRTTGDGTVGVGRPFVGYQLLFRGFCGLPADGSVKAVMVNVIAVSTTGTGYVRSAEFPFDPNSGPTVLNFNNGLVSSNAIPLAMCDVNTTTCNFDLSFRVNGGSAHIVFDLVGYFS